MSILSTACFTPTTSSVQDRFHLITTSQNYTAGLALCTALNPPGLPASFHTQAEYNLAFNMYITAFPRTQTEIDCLNVGPDCPQYLSGVFFGLGDPTNTDPTPTGVTSRFSYVDGSVFDFGKTGQTLPWNSDEPNNFEDLLENCVDVSRQTLKWNDIGCQVLRRIFCRTKCNNSPTKSPTKKPTFAPTKSPTKKPTFAPTKSPTKKLTFAPTKSPTRSPTKKPTFGPTKSPTLFPSNSPSSSPTAAPSTSEPSPSPTFAPSASPIIAPTEIPSIAKTFSPSESPVNNAAIPLPAASGSDDPALTVIVGLIGGLAAISFIILIAILFRKRRRSKSRTLSVLFNKENNNNFREQSMSIDDLLSFAPVSVVDSETKSLQNTLNSRSSIPYAVALGPYNLSPKAHAAPLPPTLPRRRNINEQFVANFSEGNESPTLARGRQMGNVPMTFGRHSTEQQNINFTMRIKSQELDINDDNESRVDF